MALHLLLFCLDFKGKFKSRSFWIFLVALLLQQLCIIEPWAIPHNEGAFVALKDRDQQLLLMRTHAE